MLNTTMRQARIQAQNMSVLTVEFTRIPLFRYWRNRQTGLQYHPHHPLDAGTVFKVTENTRNLDNRHNHPAVTEERYINFTLKKEKLIVICEAVL
jgi:hypothetical protein